MKSKFNFHVAIPEQEWDRKVDLSTINTINRDGCANVSYSGRRENYPPAGLCLLNYSENRKVGAIVSGKVCYQLCLKEDFKYVFPPLGFWFRAPKGHFEVTGAHVLMIPTYESHYKLNLARFY